MRNKHPLTDLEIKKRAQKKMRSEIIQRHIGRMNSENPDSFDDYQTIAAYHPQVLEMLHNIMEDYSNACVAKVLKSREQGQKKQQTIKDNTAICL